MSVLSILQHVFPPPSYISLPNVGVDISDASLKYIQFERKHPYDKDLALKQWGDIEIPSGVVEHGTVKDPAKLTDAMRELKSICNTEYVRVSLPEERAYLFETTLNHKMAEKEIRGMIEFKLEENVPLSPREVYFDYDVVDINPEHFHVTVAVYAKDAVNSYYEACTAAGFIPLSFEIESQAIARASVREGLMGTYMIVDFGKTRTGVGIVHKGVLMYTSSIDVGGLALSSAMRAVLGDLAESELTKIKNTQGILNSEENTEVYKTLSDTVATIEEELKTRIHYWNTRDVGLSERTIEKVFLCGGSSNLAGLPEHLTKSLNIPTERAEVWQNAFSLERFIPPITHRYSYGYATAIGLALTDFVE